MTHDEKAGGQNTATDGADSSPSGSQGNGFVDKFEHMETGYGEERDKKAIDDIEADDNPNVHQHMNIKLFMALTAMSFLWVGSQIPLYLYGSVLPDIYSEIGGANGRYIWMVIGYLIPVSALCPFVGALSDLFGRTYVAAAGQILLCIGPVVVSTSKTINTAIGGMVIAGLGAGLNELIALAGTSELVPVRKRAAYVGGVVITILPFCPSPLWAQLVAKDGGWRWVGALVGIFNFVGLLLLIAFYKDPTRDRPPAREVLRKVDFIGGLLSTAGITLFMMGMQWGARQYAWDSPHVLGSFIPGVILIVVFFCYEILWAKYPMCPREIFSKDKRTMICILFVTFFSGGNFFVMLLFWPTQVYNMYGNDPINIGIRTLPIGFGIIFGAVLSLVLIGVTKGRTTFLMLFWTIFMTGFVGAMSVARTDNLTPTVYPILTLACIGVGAVIIPCSIIAQIACPTELIGTITAITLSIRYIGGAVGFTAYYNVFFHKYFVLANTIAAPKVVEAGVTTDYFELVNLVTLASNSEYSKVQDLLASDPTVADPQRAYEIIISSVQEAFAYAYQWPYWISIAFGGVCILFSLGLRDIRQFL